MPRDYKAMQLKSAAAKTRNARLRRVDRQIDQLVEKAPELTDDQTDRLARLFRNRGDRE